ncbi:MAG: alpha/beta hydrolase [Salibacteraceae bacterium]
MSSTVSLSYSRSGQGPVLLMLHGAYTDSTIWKNQVRELGNHFTIICVDLRGHGQSPASDESTYTVGLFANDVLALADQLSIDRFYICGLSLGAMVAQNIAHRWPQRIMGLILVGTVASLRLGIVEKIVTTILFPRWLAMRLFSSLSTRQFMRLSFMMTWFMRGTRWLGSSETRKLIRDAMKRISRTELQKIYAAFHDFRLQNLENGSYPMLLINGQYDSPVILNHARYLRKKLKTRATQIVIANVGHACNVDAANEFNRIVIDWLHAKKTVHSNDQSPEKVVL